MIIGIFSFALVVAIVAIITMLIGFKHLSKEIVKFESLEFPVKIFDSPDPEYNRVCAEELVELLNQNNEKED